MTSPPPFFDPTSDGDSPPLSLQALLRARTPRVIVTPAIIAVNVAVFAAMVVQSRELSFSTATLVDWGGQFGPAIAAGQWWRLLSAMWLHGHPLHLGFNCLFLWQVGRFAERLLGPAVYFIVYLLTGVLGSVASLLYHGSLGLSVGASGALFGLVGALLAVAFASRTTHPLGAMLDDLRGSLLSVVGYNVLAGFVLPGIDNAAHLGGLAGGLAVGWLVARDSVTARPSIARTLLPAALTAAIAAGAVWLIASRHDVRTELARFELQNDRDVAAFRAALTDLVERRRTSADAAADLERAVLPPLHEARARADAMRQAAEARIAAATDLEEAQAWSAFLSAQDEAWQLRVRALRDDDPRLIDQAKERDTTAGRALSATLARPRPANPG